jgi:hypothetical protein
MEVKGLKLSDIEGRALMIHAGGDNYSDTPKPLGGGGDRIVLRRREIARRPGMEPRSRAVVRPHMRDSDAG